MNETLSLGFTVMLIGMGVVFAFLTLMIFTMNISAWVISYINKIWPEPIIEVKTTKKKKETNEDAQIALAIALAFDKEAKGKC